MLIFPKIWNINSREAFNFLSDKLMAEMLNESSYRVTEASGTEASQELTSELRLSIIVLQFEIQCLSNDLLKECQPCENVSV